MKKCWQQIILYFGIIHILKSYRYFFLYSLNNYHNVLTWISVLFLHYYQLQYNLHLVKTVWLGLLLGLCPLLESWWSMSLKGNVPVEKLILWMCTKAKYNKNVYFFIYSFIITSFLPVPQQVLTCFSTNSAIIKNWKKSDIKMEYCLCNVLWYN